MLHPLSLFLAGTYLARGKQDWRHRPFHTTISGMWFLRKARFELAQRLSGIETRLERLETTPTFEFDLQTIETTLKAVRADLERLSRYVDSHDDAVEELKGQNKDFLIALSEGIERTDRAERRVKATVARARKELKARGYEDPGLDAEAYELREVHGEGSEEQGVLPMRTAVAEPHEDPSSIRGVSRGQLRRVTGF